MKNVRALDLRIIYGGYFALAMISMIWDRLSRGNAFSAWTESQFPNFLEVIVGLVFLFVYLIVSTLTFRFTNWARHAANLLRHLLTPISYFQICLIALVSGFVEEWFFRGVLLAHFGIILSSVAFALCHLLLEQRLWVWSIWAFFAGLGFAWIYEASQSLLLCSLLHAIINAVVIARLNMQAFEEPSLRQTEE